MIDFGLLILAHMIGDYMLQNDMMAKNKTLKEVPGPYVKTIESMPDYVEADHNRKIEAIKLANKKGRFYCSIHVSLYTLAFFIVTLGALPLWAYAAIGIPHWFIDRYRLASVYMEKMGQKDFRDGVFGPWSIIVVDNTIHLINAWVVWLVVSPTSPRAIDEIKDVFSAIF